MCYLMDLLIKRDACEKLASQMPMQAKQLYLRVLELTDIIDKVVMK